MKRVDAGIVSFVFAAAVFVGVATLRTKLPGEEMTPAAFGNRLRGT
jgi:hypothetical protein